MERRSIGISLALALLVSPAIVVQTSTSEVDAHISAAKAAAGQNFTPLS